MLQHGDVKGAARRVAVWGVCVVLAAAGAAPALARDLAAEIEAILMGSPLTSATVGVVVMDVETGRTLVSINGERQFIPASNMKALTGGVALAVLGTDFVFRTELQRDGDRLIVRGGGDPAFADPKLLNDMGLELEDLVKMWVDAVRKHGGPAVREIVIDDRIFDQERVHPSWPRDQLNRWYCAEVSGLNFHSNIARVYAEPTAPVQAPKVTIEPAAPWLTARNLGRTVTTGANTVWVSRPPASNAMTLHGNVRWTTQEPVQVALHDPAMVFGRLLRDRVARAGLGDAQVRRAEPDESLPDAELVALVQTPLQVVLRRSNVDSHNLYAESLLKRLGHEITGQPGAWSSGGAVMRMVLGKKLGPQAASGVLIADGSGMSRASRVSPDIMARWLIAMHRDEQLAGPFLDSLPIAGSEGTLRRRFHGASLASEVRAKSGYLSGVSNLSGYVIDEQTGRAVVFSVLVNDIPGSLPVRRVKEFHERVVELIDGWLGEQAAPARAGAGG